MPTAAYIVEARRLVAEMVVRVGIAIEDSAPAIKRLVAQKIVNFDAELNSVRSDRDLFALKLFISELEKTLSTFSDDHRDNVGDGRGPYSIEGIEFSALVQVVRVEYDALARGWTSEDLHALGLDIHRNEEITWINGESAEITDSSDNIRYRYRLQ
jgi:hypothetical protein